MLQERNRILSDSIKRLLRRNAVPHLKKILSKSHGVDIARILPTLSGAQQYQIFKLVSDRDKQGLILGEVDQETLLDLTGEMKIDEVVVVMEKMPSDDIADILERLPEEKADEILQKMKEGSEEVQALLNYGADTAGGIMNPNFIALPEETTAQEAIRSLQKEHQDVEMVFYLYVVDGYGKLIGVCSLRQLVTVPPNKPIREIMSTDIFSVRTDMDQEEVAKIVARYDILAVPVVNHKNELVGIVTVDDVIDIIKEEATEDMLKMAGAGAEFIETKSVFKSMRIRLPWLMASAMGGVAATFIIGEYQESLRKIASLAAFIPVIMGMGGNIGTQSSTIVVRGLSTGVLSVRDIHHVVLKEMGVGFLLGIVYGVLIGLVAHLNFNLMTLGLAVGIAVVSSMSVAALVGSLMPMIFARFNVDPAVATGPFVTTSIDIIAVFIYFQISSVMLGL